MRRVTKVQVAWEGLRELLLHDDCLVLPSTSKEGEEEGAAANDEQQQEQEQEASEGGVMIKYEAFLESFAVQYGRHAASGGAGKRVFDALYANRKQVGIFCVCVCRGGEGGGVEARPSSDRTPNVFHTLSF